MNHLSGRMWQQCLSPRNICTQKLSVPLPKRVPSWKDNRMERPVCVPCRLSYWWACIQQGLRFLQQRPVLDAPCTPGAGADADAQCPRLPCWRVGPHTCGVVITDNLHPFWQTRSTTNALVLPLSLWERPAQRSWTGVWRHRVYTLPFALWSRPQATTPQRRSHWFCCWPLHVFYINFTLVIGCTRDRNANEVLRVSG